MGDNNHNQKIRYEDMSDSDLLAVWKKGCKWLVGEMQVSGTNKNSLGESYDDNTFQAGLKKIEAIETELQKRGINYE